MTGALVVASAPIAVVSGGVSPPPAPELVALTAGEVDLIRGRVHRRDGEVLRLTEREVALLRHLVAADGAEVLREDLYRSVWGYAETVVSRAIDSSVARLRKKIEVDPAHPEHLQTVHGTGYRLVLGPAPVLDQVEVAPSQTRLQLGTVSVDLRTLWVDGPAGRTRLTAAEAALLRHLSSSPGRIVPGEELDRRVFDREPAPRALTAAVRRLRRKLEEDPAAPRHLVTVRGRGVVLRLGPEVAPTGSVAFLVVRIADEGRLWEESAPTMSLVMGAVEGVVASLAPRHGGVVLARPDTRLRVAFPDLVAAIRCAVELQEVALRVPWSAEVVATSGFGEVRDPRGRLIHLGPRLAAGVHAGVARPRGSGPSLGYDGVGMAEADALAARAGGGQTLVGAGARWVAEVLPELLVAEVDELVSSVLAASLASRARTWVAAEPPIGRGPLLAEVLQSLAEPGLVQLAGLGGVGKTRLARAVAEALEVRLDGGVLWCDQPRAEGGLGRALQRVLGLADGPLEASGRALALRGDALLVFDDVDDCEELAAELALLSTAAPKLRVLLTGRHRLEGLAVIDVPPLDTAAAVELLRARAPGVASGSGAEALVEALEGLPLAIELAAGWMRSLSPEEAIARLGSDALVLEDLAAVVRWSWQRLPQEDARAATLLAGLAGWFDLDAATDLLAADGEPAPLERLRSLGDRGLLRIDHGGARTRYRLFDAVAAHARAAMRADPELEDGCRRTLLAHLAGYLSGPARSRLWHHGEGRARAAVRAALDDLAAGVELAVEAGRLELAAELARLVGEVAIEDCAWGLGAGALDRALAAELPLHLRLELSVVRARIERELLQSHGAQARLAEVLAAARELGDAVVERDAFFWAGIVARDLGDWRRASELGRASLARAVEVGGGAELARARGLVARISTIPDGTKLAQLERAVAEASADGDLRIVASAWWNWSAQLLDVGRPGLARDGFQRVIEAGEEIQSPLQLSYARRQLAYAIEQQGDLDALERALVEALEAVLRLGERTEEALIRLRRASLRVRTGRLADARVDLEFAEPLLRERPDSPTTAYLWFVRTLYHLAWRDLASAEECARRSVEVFRRGHRLDGELEAQALLVHVQLRLGRIAQAEAHMAEIRERVPLAPPESRVSVACSEAELAAGSGEPERARAILADARLLLLRSGQGEHSPAGFRLAEAAEAVERPAG